MARTHALCLYNTPMQWHAHKCMPLLQQHVLAQLVLDTVCHKHALVSKDVGGAVLLEAQAAPRIQHKSQGAVRNLKVCRAGTECKVAGQAQSLETSRNSL
eukprot:1148256-Pelagomonas_calceolata.AAC.3